MAAVHCKAKVWGQYSVLLPALLTSEWLIHDMWLQPTLVPKKSKLTKALTTDPAARQEMQS